MLSKNDTYTKIMPQIKERAKQQTGGIQMNTAMDIWYKEAVEQGRAESENFITSLFSKLFVCARTRRRCKARNDRQRIPQKVDGRVSEIKASKIR